MPSETHPCLYFSLLSSSNLVFEFFGMLLEGKVLLWQMRQMCFLFPTLSSTVNILLAVFSGRYYKVPLQEWRFFSPSAGREPSIVISLWKFSQLERIVLPNISFSNSLQPAVKGQSWNMKTDGPCPLPTMDNSEWDWLRSLLGLWSSSASPIGILFPNLSSAVDPENTL